MIIQINVDFIFTICSPLNRQDYKSEDISKNISGKNITIQRIPGSHKRCIRYNQFFKMNLEFLRKSHEI